MPSRRITFFDFLNVYLLETPAGPVLVDSAAPGMMPWLRRALGRLGLAPRDLAGVVVTHFHRDHVGTALALSREGVPVHALAAEVPYLTGAATHPGYGPTWFGRMLHALETRVLGPLTFTDVRPLEDGESLFDSSWTVVAAPGHTPGSLALFDRDRGDLLSGDTLVNQLGRPRGPHPAYTADRDRALQSALALLDREPRRILPGHGRPVERSAFDRERERWVAALGGGRA